MVVEMLPDLMPGHLVEMPQVPRDPKREKRRKSKAANIRRVKELAHKAKVHNRDTFLCATCNQPIPRGAPFYLHHNAAILFATITCPACYAEHTPEGGRVPAKQATLVQEVSSS